MMSNSGDPAQKEYDEEKAPDQALIQQLIYDYLVHHCFSNTAQTLAMKDNKAFTDPDAMDVDTSSSSYTPESYSSTTLAYRKQLRGLILSGTHARLKLGNILESIEFIKNQFPFLLSQQSPSYVMVRFLLKCQHFIELVRVHSPAALEYAQSGNFFV